MTRYNKNNCVICEKKIDKSKEKYVNLRDYNGKKFESECFYHIDCWKNRFVITQEKIQGQADKWMKGMQEIGVKIKKEQEIAV